MAWTSALVQSKRNEASGWDAVDVPVDSRVICSSFAWSESKSNVNASSTCYHWCRSQAISDRWGVAKNGFNPVWGYDVSRLSQHVKKFDRLLAKCYKTSFLLPSLRGTKGSAGVVLTRP